MDMSPTIVSSTSDESSGSNKNTIIIVLVTLLLLSILGINMLTILGTSLQHLVSFVSPVILQFLSTLGYTVGTVIDKSEDVASTTAKTGIDIFGGAIDDVANLLKGGNQANVLDKAIHSSGYKINEPKEDASTNPIQKPITSNKNANWCLVGEYEGRRGCIEIGDQDKCLSGQIFPDRQTCIKPIYAENVSPLKPVFTRN